MARLLRYIKPFAPMVAAVIILVFLQSLADLNLPTLMADIVNEGIAAGDSNFIWRTGAIMLTVALGGAACAVVSGYLSARISAGFGRDLRSRVFAHVESFSLHEFDRIGTASLITRTTNDITQIQMVVLVMLRMVVMAPMMCVGGIVMAVIRNGRLSLVFAGALPVLSVIIAAAITRGIPLFDAMQKKIDRLNLVVRESLTGFLVIRAFNRSDSEAARFDEANRDLTNTAIRVNRILAGLMPVTMLVMNLTTIAIIWAGSRFVDAGSLQVGDMMAFIQYAMQIMWSLVMVSSIFVMLPRASASANRVNEVLNSVPGIMDADNPETAGTVNGRLEFRDVTFRYPGAEEPALNGISFEANPGEVTAITGKTGSGKSTLVNLIPRFYDVDDGDILLGGVDIRRMKQEDLRARIGMVPQKAVLFTGTIADNIRFGKEDASDGEVRRAAEIAQAVEFVDEMEDGFDSAIARGGTNVSGGQKQRLSIARALVRRPDIYVFDDSFSALDFKTDSRLRAGLKAETRGATVLIVAQRVSTIADADRIIVLDEGRVVGNGRHKDLMRTCDVYRQIVSSQLSEEEIA